MRSLVESAESISAQTVGKAIHVDQETGVVDLEIEGVGIQEVEIVSTPGNLGGRLRWFVCPGCGRRAGKLYLPKEDSVFLCWRCHRLEYRQQALREFRKAPDGRKDSDGRARKRQEAQKMLDWLKTMLRAGREKR